MREIDELLLSHIKSKDSLFITPGELFSLPVGTLLKPDTCGGLPSYKCELNTGAVLHLEERTKTPTGEVLGIMYRGTPQKVRFNLSSRSNMIALGTGITITVLGRVLPHRSSDYWAFLDSIESPVRRRKLA